MFVILVELWFSLNVHTTIYSAIRVLSCFGTLKFCSTFMLDIDSFKNWGFFSFSIFFSSLFCLYLRLFDGVVIVISSLISWFSVISLAFGFDTRYWSMCAFFIFWYWIGSISNQEWSKKIIVGQMTEFKVFWSFCKIKLKFFPLFEKVIVLKYIGNFDQVIKCSSNCLG